MIGDYKISTPSLEGLLGHQSIEYDGLDRPIEILRLFEGPAARGYEVADEPVPDPGEQKLLEKYFDDLFRVFMKRLSHFVVGSSAEPRESVELQAMLQEMIKVKGLISRP